MKFVFKDDFGELDYIACWFLMGADFIRNTNAKYAFVSTNSICQGLQTSLLWERIFDKGLAIDFVYTSFKWVNNAKNKVAVMVVVIGVSNENNIKTRKLFYNII